MNANDLDLSPRPVEPAARRRRGPRRWAPIALIALAVVAGGVIVAQFLRSAVDYYCNVDEIDVRSGCDASRRLRVQGVVEEGTVAREGAFTTFVLGFGGATLDVRYRGEPGGMFNECEPVVVHGRLADDGAFQGDTVEVRHSNEYAAENPDRVDDGRGPNCPDYDDYDDYGDDHAEDPGGERGDGPGGED